MSLTANLQLGPMVVISGGKVLLKQISHFVVHMGLFLLSSIADSQHVSHDYYPQPTPTICSSHVRLPPPLTSSIFHLD